MTIVDDIEGAQHRGEGRLIVDHGEARAPVVLDERLQSWPPSVRAEVPREDVERVRNNLRVDERVRVERERVDERVRVERERVERAGLSGNLCAKRARSSREMREKTP